MVGAYKNKQKTKKPKIKNNIKSIKINETTLPYKKKHKNKTHKNQKKTRRKK